MENNQPVLDAPKTIKIGRLTFTLNVLLQAVTHPVAFVTVTLYAPAADILQATAPVAVKPPGPDHEYVLPPVTVKHVEDPWQIVLLPETLQSGSGFTTRVLLQILVHPPLVDVTL